jgi:hypothetical protein
VIRSSSQAPAKDARIAGMPNLKQYLFVCILSYQRDLEEAVGKVHQPVRAIATSTGKNMAKTGNSIVPSPNPEKKVSIEAKKAAATTAVISIRLLLCC